MSVKQAISEELRLLLDQKGKTCVSIILPLHNLTIDQKADKIHLEKAVEEVCEELNNNYPEASKKIVSSLHHLQQQVKFNRNDEGIGIYASEELSFYTTFPFFVSENLLVDTCFRIRELLMREQYAIAYNILYVDAKEIRLFTGKLKQLQEIRNGEFPMIYEDEYEYQPSSRTTSYAGESHVKSFEKDKGALDKIRRESFIKQADEILHKYIEQSQVLVLCGTTRYTSAFLNRTTHADKVVTVLNGNYNNYSEIDFASMVWPSVDAFIYEKMVDEISNYNEKIGEGLAEEGITAVWDAVCNGRGETLLIEKSFEIKAFTTNQNSWHLLLQPPQKQHTELKDAVNSLLEILLEKKGRVVFTENGMLSDHQHIALITRFHYF